MTNITRRLVLKKPLNLFLVLLVVGGLIAMKPAVKQSKPDKFETKIAANSRKLDSIIATKMKEHSLPGLSMVIFRDRKIVYSRTFGVKNASTGEPVDEKTVFQGASFSKTLTAYAAMILVERGKLALDKPLNQYLKREYLPDPTYADRITLRMILNHTSGMSNDSDGNDRDIYFTPGACFSYSGAGFRYLQQVIEDVTGMPFERFVDREIFKPLDMNSSSFVFKPKMVPFMASGHESGVALPLSETRKPVNAAYSLLTTPIDMAKFNIEICHPTLLRPETVARMLRPSVRWQGNIYWGLGMGILKTPGEDFYWHWGNNYYYTNMMIAGKDSKTGVVIMTNGNTGMRLSERLAIRIINTLILGKNDPKIDPKTFDFIS